MNPKPTEEWAKAQEDVIKGWKDRYVLAPYEPMCWAQRAICVTNLVIRQDALMGRSGEARKGFLQLTRKGFWDEHLSYLNYTLAAFTYSDPDVTSAASGMMLNYGFIASPTQEVPIPETGGDRVGGTETSDFHNGDMFIVRRWGMFKPNRYVLLGVDEDMETNCRNFHRRPVGYALWASSWLARVPPYTGYNASDLLLDEADRGNTVPRGIFTPEWRLNPPTVHVTRRDADHVQVVYRTHWGLRLPPWPSKVVRDYLIAPDCMEVKDNNKTVFKG